MADARYAAGPSGPWTTREQSGEPVLVVAADVPSAPEAIALADQLSGLPVWLKVGLELFTAEGPSMVRGFLSRQLPVFLDLKFHDIPNTVRRAVRSASLLGAQMLTVHVGGGAAMCRAAAAGKADSLEARPDSPAPLVMGITVLTSDSGDAESLGRLVLERARLARDCGLDGIVCSGWEVAAVKEACGRDFVCLCPGIRFAGTAGKDDQARVCTPGEAVRQGADFIVMGRPVLQSADRAEAVRRALREMRQERDSAETMRGRLARDS